MKIQSESAEQMANYHSQIQDQRHQAEMRQLANQYSGLHRELQRYRNREQELAQREIEINEQQGPHKVRVVTREIANEPFNNPSSSSTDVPAPPPPPKAIGPIATAAPLALPPPPKAPAKAPPAKAKAKALPTTRDALIAYIDNSGRRTLTNDETQNSRRGGLTVQQLRQIARNLN